MLKPKTMAGNLIIRHAANVGIFQITIPSETFAQGVTERHVSDFTQALAEWIDTLPRTTIEAVSPLAPAADPAEPPDAGPDRA